jgi:hypothetical protein
VDPRPRTRLGEKTQIDPKPPQPPRQIAFRAVSAMKYLKIFLCILTVIVVGCGTRKERYPTVTLTYFDISYQYSNPYTPEDFALANEFLYNRIVTYKRFGKWEAYFVPMKYVNRLVVIPLSYEDTLRGDLRQRLEEDLMQFLTERIKTRDAKNSQEGKERGESALSREERTNAEGKASTRP